MSSQAQQEIEKQKRMASQVIIIFWLSHITKPKHLRSWSPISLIIIQHIHDSLFLQAFTYGDVAKPGKFKLATLEACIGMAVPLARLSSSVHILL